MKRRIFILGVIAFILLVAGSGVYWASNLPRMTMMDGKYEITNCEPPMPKYAKGVCPKLYCKKAILESGMVPSDAEVGFKKTKKEIVKVIFGAVRYRGPDEDYIIRRFQCTMDGYDVVQLLEDENAGIEAE